MTLKSYLRNIEIVYLILTVNLTEKRQWRYSNNMLVKSKWREICLIALIFYWFFVVFVDLDISDSAEADPCIRCPVTKGYCLNFAQTQSSVAAINVYASSGDLNGGFNFRFIAVSSTSKGMESYSFTKQS